MSDLISKPYIIWCLTEEIQKQTRRLDYFITHLQRCKTDKSKGKSNKQKIYYSKFQNAYQSVRIFLYICKNSFFY